MKCSKCGKEFGEGVNCQNCGVDRVTGLANYSNYGTSDYQGTNASYYDSSYNYSPKTMACYSCGEIIPIDSEYCPYCRKKLYETCPKCGATYSSQFKACNKCGTDRTQYYLKLKAEEQEKRIQEKKRTEELNIRHEASVLSRQLEGNGLAIWWIVLFILLVVGVVNDKLINDMTTGISLAIGWISVGVIGQCIISLLENQRVKKWKQEHPNDPRSKYL